MFRPPRFHKLSARFNNSFCSSRFINTVVVLGVGIGEGDLEAVLEDLKKLLLGGGGGDWGLNIDFLHAPSKFWGRGLQEKVNTG